MILYMHQWAHKTNHVIFLKGIILIIIEYFNIFFYRIIYYCNTHILIHCSLVLNGTVHLIQNWFKLKYFFWKHSKKKESLFPLGISYIPSILYKNCSTFVLEPIQRLFIFRFPKKVLQHGNQNPERNGYFNHQEIEKKNWLQQKLSLVGNQRHSFDN